MSVEARRFGTFEVTRLLDGLYEPSKDVLVHHAGDEATARLRAAWPGDIVRLPVNCFLLRDDTGASTLVDAGTGTIWGPALGHAREGLAAAGVAPEAVGRILLTHVHGDHAYGLLDGKAAYYPNAEILIPAPELEYLADEAARGAAPEAARPVFELAADILAAYGNRVRAVPAGEVMPGIRLLPLPGHTIGHSGFLLEGENPLLLWGDTMHLLDVQPGDPDAAVVFDVDGKAAAATRRRVLGEAADAGWTVAGAHIPVYATVTRDGDVFRLQPV